MNDSRWFAFEFAPNVLGLAVHVRLADRGDRWAATVRCGTATTDALGANAREALVAALAPLGAHATTRLMAEPTMFGPSATLLARAAV
jgi:hypothetical protein